MDQGCLLQVSHNIPHNLYMVDIYYVPLLNNIDPLFLHHGAALPMLIGSEVARRPIKLSMVAESLASLVQSPKAISLTFIILVTPWSIL